MTLLTTDINSQEDKNSIIRLWEGEGFKINTAACQNKKNHNQDQCCFSHEFLQNYPLVRCRYCADGYCHDKNVCALRDIPDKFLGYVTVYCVCRGFADALQADNHDEDVEHNNNPDDSVDHHEHDVVLGTEELEPITSTQSISDSPFRKTLSFNPEPMFHMPAPASPVLTSNYINKLTTIGKIKRSNPNAYVHLTVNTTTIDALLLIITRPEFEGILKLNARKFEDMVAELEPLPLLKFEEALSKIPVGETLMQIAKLKLQNEELQRQLLAASDSSATSCRGRTNL